MFPDICFTDFNKVTGKKKKRFSLKIDSASSGFCKESKFLTGSWICGGFGPLLEEGWPLCRGLFSIKGQDGNHLCEADLVSAPALFTEHRSLF